MAKVVNLKEIGEGLYELQLEEQFEFNDIKHELICDVVFWLEENEENDIDITLERVNKFQKNTSIYMKDSGQSLSEEAIYDNNKIIYRYEREGIDMWQENININLEGKSAKAPVEDTIKKTIELEMYYLMHLN